MSTVHYKKLFSVAIEHDFYEDRVSRSLSISPTLRCAKIISQLGLRIEAQAAGVTMFCDSEQDVAKLLQQVMSEAETDCFEFNVSSNDPAFLNCTDLPIQPLRKALYSSEATHEGADEKKRYFGQPAFSSDTIGADQPIANLKIYFSDLPEINLGETAADFMLVLKARSVYWKYYLVSPSPDEFADTEITDNQGITFGQSPVRETLPNQQEAWVYSYPQPLAFREVQKYPFDLVRKDSGGEVTVLIKGLPLADPASLVIEQDQDGNVEPMYCPIYIHL